jgi:hypothetical protein
MCIYEPPFREFVPEASDVRFRTRPAIDQGAPKANEHEVNNMPKFVLTAEVEDLEK